MVKLGKSKSGTFNERSDFLIFELCSLYQDGYHTQACNIMMVLTLPSLVLLKVEAVCIFQVHICTT